MNPVFLNTGNIKIKVNLKRNYFILRNRTTYEKENFKGDGL